VCNDFDKNVPYSDYLAAFSQIRVRVVFPTAAPNQSRAARSDIRPTETAPVFRRRERGPSSCSCVGGCFIKVTFFYIGNLRYLIQPIT